MPVNECNNLEKGTRIYYLLRLVSQPTDPKKLWCGCIEERHTLFNGQVVYTVISEENGYKGDIDMVFEEQIAASVVGLPPNKQ